MVVIYYFVIVHLQNVHDYFFPREILHFCQYDDEKQTFIPFPRMCFCLQFDRLWRFIAGSSEYYISTGYKVTSRLRKVKEERKTRAHKHSLPPDT